MALPVELDNYYGMSMADDKLLFVRSGPFYYGRGSDIRPSIHFFDFDEREVKKVADAGGYALSADGKKLLVRGGGAFELLDVAPDAKGERVSDGEMHADVDYAQEWETIFDEVWRRFRDFFYVDNMHGYDWEAIGEQYRELLPHVAHRSDLNYVIGEMIAELNVSHAYIAGGDYEIPDRPDVALPGARIEFDADGGRYRLAEIYPGPQRRDPVPVAADRSRHECRCGRLPAGHRRGRTRRDLEPLRDAALQVGPSGHPDAERAAAPWTTTSARSPSSRAPRRRRCAT